MWGSIEKKAIVCQSTRQVLDVQCPASLARVLKEEWLLAEWAKNRPKMLGNLARLAATVNVEPLLPDVSVPTLILAPAKSPISPLDEQVKMRRLQSFLSE